MTETRARSQAGSAPGSGARSLAAGLAIACAVYSPGLRAEDYSILYSFYDYARGYPKTGVIFDADGNLVGTLSGPPYVSLFRLAPTGDATFAGQIYGEQGGGLTLAENGTVFGTTYGLYDDETLFEIDAGNVIKLPPSGQAKRLHSFGFDPSPVPHNPCGKLAVDGKNNIYGTAAAHDAEGVVFRVTALGGGLKVLHTFPSGGQGGYPGCSAIALDASGSLYGKFNGGGGDGYGGVFKIDANNQYTVVHTFKASEGSPAYGVTLDKDGNIYGTTSNGGANKKGSIFKIAPDGTTTTIFSFGGAQGSSPLGAVLRDGQGNFYGTADGGLHGCGVVYKVTSAGQGFTLHDFCATSGDGYKPLGRLTSDGKGYIYGTTEFGGAHNFGTVFKVAR